MTYICNRRAKPNGVGSEVYDNCLQLRRDAMRIPKQFFHKNRELEGVLDAENYFSFNQATEEADESRSRNQNRSAILSSQQSAAVEGRLRSNSVGGHPLVPRLNLPRPDPNAQWREIMAQAQSYEDVESSSNQHDVSESYEDGESEEESMEESEEEESESQSASVSANGARSRKSKKSKKSASRSKASQKSQKRKAAGVEESKQAGKLLRPTRDGAILIAEEEGPDLLADMDNAIVIIDQKKR